MIGNMGNELLYPDNERKFTSSFMITSVRHADEAERERQLLARQYLEGMGIQTYLPFVDTEQEDPAGGINIIKANFEAIRRVVTSPDGVITVMYSPNSSGSVADIGTAMAVSMMSGTHLNLHILNPEELDEEPAAEILTDLVKGESHERLQVSSIYIEDRLFEYTDGGSLHYTWREDTKDPSESFSKYFELGVITAIMLYNPDARLEVSNLDEVVIPNYPKSYQHVIHALAERGLDADV